MLDEAIADARAGTLSSHGPLTDDEWTRLVENGFADAIRDDPSSGRPRAFGWIASTLRPPRKGRKRSPGFRVSEQVRRQQDVVSELLAIHAGREDARLRLGVAKCRSVLPEGKLLRLEQVHVWVESRAAQEGLASANALDLLIYRRYLKLKHPAKNAQGALFLNEGLKAEPWVRYVQTVPSGDLHNLRETCERLSNYYGWHQSAAVAFVLAGAIPQEEAIRFRVEPNIPLPCRTRMVLSIDPTCTPDEVRALYAHVRRQEFGRLRRLGEKHARLAIFALKNIDRRGPDFKPAQEGHLDAWNNACKRFGHRDWRYSRLSAFDRDCHTALNRLLLLGNWERENLSRVESARYTSEADYRRLKEERWVVENKRRTPSRTALAAARTRMVGERTT